MAHTYIITSITHTSIDDFAIVTGSVDGTTITAQASWAHILSLPSTTAVQNYLAPIMLAAVPPIATVTTTFIFNGTFTQ